MNPLLMFYPWCLQKYVEGKSEQLWDKDEFDGNSRIFINQTGQVADLRDSTGPEVVMMQKFGNVPALNESMHNKQN